MRLIKTLKATISIILHYITQRLTLLLNLKCLKYIYGTYNVFSFCRFTKSDGSKFVMRLLESFLKQKNQKVSVSELFKGLKFQRFVFEISRQLRDSLDNDIHVQPESRRYISHWRCLGFVHKWRHTFEGSKRTVNWSRIKF